IAKLAADRVEDQIDTAPLPQAVVTFGVMTDKIDALSNDPLQLNVNIAQTIEPSKRDCEKLNALADTIEAQARVLVVESSDQQTRAVPQVAEGKTDAIEQRALARRALPESSNKS